MNSGGTNLRRSSESVYEVVSFVVYIVPNYDDNIIPRDTAREVR